MSEIQSTEQICYYKTAEKDKIVQYFYIREPEAWHKTIHKRAGTIEQNIKDTLDSISESSEMYVVKSGYDVAGFFVKHTELISYLEGFHIAKAFRTKKFILEFWRIVKQEFGCYFSTGICSKNQPAIDHLVRQGFVATDKKYFDGYTFIILTCKI